MRSTAPSPRSSAPTTLPAASGAININVLWEMGGAQRVLHGVLERTKGLVAGVTCGAGMPYKLSEIAASYGVNYLPIISSGRAFRALWKRAYSKAAEWLAAVVYEDPWLAGGHNGLSNAEDPLKPQDPYPRVKAIARDDARGRHSRQRSDRHGGRSLESEGMGELDRQSRARPDRLPVRHPAPAHQGKPDPRELEAEADDPRGRRHPAPPLLADRLLQLGGAQPVPAQPRGALAPPDRLHQGGAGRPLLPARRRSRRQEEFLGDPRRPAPRPRMVRAGLYRGAQDPGRDPDLRHAGGEGADPQGPGRLHGLPQPMRLLVLGGQ